MCVFLHIENNINVNKNILEAFPSICFFSLLSPGQVFFLQIDNSFIFLSLIRLSLFFCSAIISILSHSSSVAVNQYETPDTLLLLSFQLHIHSTENNIYLISVVSMPACCRYMLILCFLHEFVSRDVCAMGGHNAMINKFHLTDNAKDSKSELIRKSLSLSRCPVSSIKLIHEISLTQMSSISLSMCQAKLFSFNSFLLFTHVHCACLSCLLYGDKREREENFG